MKKSKKIMLFFLVITLLFISNVSAKTYSGRFYEEGWQTAKVGVYAKEKSGRLDYNGWFIRSTKDKNIYYCVDPNLQLNGSSAKSHTIYVDKSNMLKYSKLNKSNYEKINLLAYYGYGYKDSNYNHKDKKWYGVTQVMIWRVVNSNTSWTFKKSRYGSTSNSYFKKEVSEMNTLVNNHNKKSSFSDSNQKIKAGSTITLTDKNKVLSNYSVSSNSNIIKVAKNGNDLNITGIKNGKAIINFKKDSNVNDAFTLYASKTYQDLVKKGSVSSVSFNMTVEVTSNRINLQKEDTETGSKPQGGLSFKDALYSVYDSNNKKVGEIKTDENGKGDITVSNGTYTLKEEKAPKGYEINKELYKVVVNSKDESLKVKDEVIKGKLEIVKEKGSEKDGYNKEKGAEFEIYDTDNKIVDTIKTNDDGYASLDLVYGKYKVRQVNGSDGYAFVDDFFIDINKKDKYSYNLKNEKKSKLVFTKTDFSTKKPVPNTLIEIYKDTGELIFKKRTDSNGKVEIDKLDIGKYYILEKDAPRYYLLNKEKMPFEIKKNGEIVKCNMENHRKVGGIKFLKKDSIDGKPLKGAKIEVYFDETKKKVYTGYTNNNGEISINNLVAGKYCIYEIKAPKGYKTSKKPVCTIIDEQDKIVSVFMTNKKNILIPDTFLNDNKKSLISIIIVSVLGVIFIIYETFKGKKKI